MNFIRLSEDNFIFLNKNSKVIIVLYIDNLLIFLKKMNAVTDIKMKLYKMYNMKDLSKTDICLKI